MMTGSSGVHAQGRKAGPIERFATNDRVLDDNVTFEASGDGYWHFPAGSQVEMTLVHIESAG